MKNMITIKRICKNALLLALFCVIGMFSIPLGANIKVSLQLLMVYVICLICDSVFDGLIIIGLYVLLGLFLPIYAGFSSSISPTFGFVPSFIIICPIIYFLNKIPKLNKIIRMSIACFAGLIICYICGTIFMMFYLSWDLVSTLKVAVLPYIPFDIVKIVLAIMVILALPMNQIKNNEEK